MRRAPNTVEPDADNLDRFPALASRRKQVPGSVRSSGMICRGRRLFGLSGRACFRPEKSELVCIVLDLLFDADAGGVTAGGAVVEKNRAAAL